MRRMSGWTGRWAVAGLAVLALALAGCGNGSSGGGGSKSPTSLDAKIIKKVTKDDALAAKVPAAIGKDGTVTIGTDSSYPPSETLAADGKTVVGFDVDLFNAVLAKLGLKGSWQSADFGTIIAGVESGKYEAGVSSFTINSDRLKQANMVSYYSAGIWWATKKGNPKHVSPDNACGKRIAVQADTVEADDLATKNKQCPANNKITIEQYVHQDQATSAVVSGKDDAMSADSPVIAYALKKTHGQLQTLGSIYESAPYGYVVNKDQLAFAQALRAAVQALISDGTYGKILKNWGVESGKIDNPSVNPSV